MSKRKTRKEKIKSQQRLEFNRIEIKRLISANILELWRLKKKNWYT